jgi:acid phosphatase type 7
MLRLIALSLILVLSDAQVFPQPEQIHLSIGLNDGDYVLTWVTLSSTNESTVFYGEDMPLSMKATGTEDLFIDGGYEKRQLFMHRVTLPNLKPKTKYLYRVGSSFGWSSVTYFRTLPVGQDWSPRFAVFGDMGNKNGRSIPYLQVAAENGDFDMILHVGDMAYDMNTNDALYGDEFMRQIEPVASIVPYMTCPGNHENAYNFSNYRRRFSMPGGDGEGQFYSFNVGRAHIIAYNTEYYYYTGYGWQQIANQYKWLENDLKIANLPENRAKHPWIIVMGHRPMYCSNNDDPEHCVTKDNWARVGVPVSSPYGKTYLYRLEDLFYKWGVDLLFWAHEHSYERMWPTYDLKVCNGTRDPNDPYLDAPAPVHIVTGSAGNQEGEDPFIPGGQPWSAFRTDDYGYTRMNVINTTHLTLEQVSVDQGGEVVDRLTYIRTKHGPGMYRC